MTKTFPGVRATIDVDFDLRAGEIAGIVGENGAGKSTLMKVIAGIYPVGSYEGSITVKGDEAAFRSVYDAETAGVVLVPQELYIAPQLSIAENMFIGRLPTRRGLVDQDALHQRARRWLDFFDITSRPFARAATLTPSEQREVMIAAALSKQADVLILDEPTASMSLGETERLFEHLHRLAESGVGIVYISHRLDEIERITDSVTVMRNGRVVARFDREAINHRDTVRAMIGRDPESLVAHGRGGAPEGEPLLHVSDLYAYDPLQEETPRVKGVSLTVHRGEVVGLFGLVGAGRSELARSLFGSWGGRVQGTMEVAGIRRLPKSPAEALRLGIAMVTEDRKKWGIFEGQSVGANISAASIDGVARGKVWINGEAEYSRNESLSSRLAIKAPSLHSWIDFLSGGNQQKTIVARWLAAAPSILILDEPTTGVDVGARFELYQIIHALADEGRGVLFISSDLEEVVGQCDRVLVMYKGELRQEFPASPDRHELMLAATGGV
ncbi:MAG: sugar ABC transporter ATP-binding protein [Gaiellales bacterium]